MSANDRSTAPHASILRPRNNRLISGLSDDEDSVWETPHGSSSRRPASPIPPPHPQRPSTQSGRTVSGYASRDTVGRQGRRINESLLLSNLWGPSWSALQGIASDLLGTELEREPNANPRAGRSASRAQSPRAPVTGSVSSWGPSAASNSYRSTNGIGAGTGPGQTAAFRAQKQKDLLTGSDSTYADALGRFKRRSSDDRASASAPPAEHNREALIYVHRVHKDDTLAGITIRYNIAVNDLRKANRMWPNDTVQARQTLILPVDACGVKGRPCRGPGEEIDLLTLETQSLSTLHAEEVPAPGGSLLTSDERDGPNKRARNDSQSIHTTSSLGLTNTDADPPWHHDSWVMLPGCQKPTEIARLPRQALGYFPPARRKSQTFSDSKSPSTSLELQRAPRSEDATGVGSPTQRSSPRRDGITRRPSNATNGYFPNFLSGPGGVGTMSRNDHFPGPAQDGLNKLFAKHLPDVAPPRHQMALLHPDVPLYSDDPTPMPSGAVTPAYPHSLGRTKSAMNIENVGGAIESWVRRLTTKATTSLPDRQQAARVSVGAPGKGAGGIGDLIEMTDEFEIGGDEEEEERGRIGWPSLLSQDSTLHEQDSGLTSSLDGSSAWKRGSNIGPGKSRKAD